ncbi:MAG TPA: NERD domain-containing protein [Thermoanaerobaculia bacterium]|nr:NERD domain-containing protein [Thermoanaerobaculia bacterium]
MRIPTVTEAFVNGVCRTSFLSLWSYASPQGRTAGKEMCDVLVICDPDVVIFSVKEVQPKKNVRDTVRFGRWVRGAVDESVAQIYGAERFINSGKVAHVVQENGSEGLPYPDPQSRRIHRVAVALGGDDHFPVPFGDFGKGFVHVLDKRSFDAITSELNTITDFVEYLRRKEDLFSSEKKILLAREEDLVAIYLHGNRAFPDANMLIDEGAWEQFTGKPEVLAKRKADKDSFLWDRLIERIGRDVAARNMLIDRSLADDEMGLRVMARENRFNRRILGAALRTFFEASSRNEVRSRMIESLSGVGYVFLAVPRDEDRELRNMELSLRCYVARSRLESCITIIGIGTEQKTGESGASWDVHLLHVPQLDAGIGQKASRISDELGYFKEPRMTPLHEDEYPGSCPGDDAAPWLP